MSWFEMADLPGVKHVYDFLELHDGTILAATGDTDGDVFRSIDGGKTWQNSSTGIISTTNTIARFYLCSNNSIYLGAANPITSAGTIYVSHNDGLSWNNITNGISATETCCWDFVQLANGSMFAATRPNGKIYVSHDFGLSWSENIQLPGVIQAYSLCLTRNGSIWVGTQPNGNVFVSHNEGGTWINASEGITSSGTYVLRIIQTENGDFFAACEDTSKSFVYKYQTDGIWKKISTNFNMGIRIYSPLEANDGSLFVGGREGGLSKIYRLKPTFNQSSPIITPKSSIQSENMITQWTGFNEISDLNGQSIKHQLSFNDGATWYYWNGTAWIVTLNQWNDAETINANLFTFPTSNGKILVRSNLTSNGLTTPELDEIMISYIETPLSPVPPFIPWGQRDKVTDFIIYGLMAGIIGISVLFGVLFWQQHKNIVKLKDSLSKGKN